MTATDDRLEAIEQRLAAIQAVLGPAALDTVALATINPDGTPGPVAPGELIESAWGNATSTWVTKLKNSLPRHQAQVGVSAGNLPTGNVTEVHAGGLAVPVLTVERVVWFWWFANVGGPQAPAAVTLHVRRANGTTSIITSGTPFTVTTGAVVAVCLPGAFSVPADVGETIRLYVGITGVNANCNLGGHFLYGNLPIPPV